MEDINRKTLSDYERSYVDKTGYWEKQKTSSRAYAIEVANEEKNELPTATHVVKVRSDQCFIPKLGCILEDYIDIAQIFNRQELMNSFIHFLFEYATEDNINGGSTFYYYTKSQTYNFDYPYILHIIIKWAVSELGANQLGFTRFIRQFSPSKNISFLHANYFLISVIFGDTYSFLSPSTNAHFRKNRINNKVIYYFNPTIVEAGDGEEYFFYSIPISASKILFACEEDTVLYLLEARQDLRLKQTLFGKDVLNHSTIKTFFKIDFP